jgi:hypothetical protein
MFAFKQATLGNSMGSVKVMPAALHKKVATVGKKATEQIGMHAHIA